MAPPIPYIAEIQAREVGLTVAADLGYWRDRLQPEGIYPASVHGRAELTLSAIASKYMGLRFHELIIAIWVTRQADGAVWEAPYLIHAFNTSRLFTFFERFMFRTPYRYAWIDFQDTPPAHFKVGALLQAQRGDTTPSAQVVAEDWQGAIWLPGGTQFFARLAGRTEVYPFAPAADRLELAADPSAPVLQGLIDSHATGVEWRMRNQAVHARSKTVARS